MQIFMTHHNKNSRNVVKRGNTNSYWTTKASKLQRQVYQNYSEFLSTRFKTQKHMAGLKSLKIVYSDFSVLQNYSLKREK